MLVPQAPNAPKGNSAGGGKSLDPLQYGTWKSLGGGEVRYEAGPYGMQYHVLRSSKPVVVYLPPGWSVMWKVKQHNPLRYHSLFFNAEGEKLTRGFGQVLWQLEGLGHTQVALK